MEERVWSGLGQAIAGVMFIWAMASKLLPADLHTYFIKRTRKLWGFFRPYIDITFHEYSGERFRRSEAYATIQTYLSATTSKSAKRLTADIGRNSSRLVLSLDVHEEVTDEFRGVRVWWTSGRVVARSSTISFFPGGDERKHYKLTFHRAHLAAMDDYLKHVLEEGEAIEVRNRQRKMFTNSSDGAERYSGSQKRLWSHVVFEHPGTFDSVAMDPEKKAAIVDDLDSFKNGKEFYGRIGRAWKRGYLLYGPPGTGKSTMIAAMANYLEYDVYDLELTAVKDNTQLRKLMIETTSKSIIVIEDIDCSEDLTKKRKPKKKDHKEGDEQPPGPPANKDESDEKGSKVTLSGLLNFIDGLWSTSCGGERLIVFTTNHIEKLDPALIRSGRMDVHVEMSYCCFGAFKVLAKNYLLLEEHPLFEKVREMLEVEGVKMTPADVAENLMPKTSSARAAGHDTAGICLRSLVQALEKAKIQTEEGGKEGEVASTVH